MSTHFESQSTFISIKMETTNTSPFAFLSKFAITFKLIVIGFMAILLLIPAVMIQELIHEREMLKQTAVAEIGSKWAEAQLISGPIMTFPMQFEKTENQKTSSYVEHLHVLPDDLKVTGTIYPEQLKRGIFTAIVYRSDIEIRGTFQVPAAFDEAHFVGIKGDKATINVGLGDLRGVEEVVNLKWGTETFAVSPGSTIPDLHTAGFHVALPMEKLSPGAEIPFSIQLKLRGSESIYFIPVGQTTEIKLSSAWSSPKFDGKFLPNDRKLDEEGFEASWKVLELNRNFPQQWKDDSFNAQLKAAAFGVELLSPMEDYQKSLRSAKYALLTISLTFLMFFFGGDPRKEKHPPIPIPDGGPFYLPFLRIADRHIGAQQLQSGLPDRHDSCDRDDLSLFSSAIQNEKIYACPRRHPSGNFWVYFRDFAARRLCALDGKHGVVCDFGSDDVHHPQYRLVQYQREFAG